MSDPIFNGNNPYPYFTCDRDPATSEPDVTAIGIPSDWLFWWWNTQAEEIFRNKANVEDALEWAKMADFSNIIAMLAELGWTLNTVRDYSQIGSPTFNTPRTPSLTNDTQITAIVQLTSTLLASADVQAQIDSGSGYVTRSEVGLSGIAAINKQTLSFIVPAGSSYKLIETGTTSIISINELTL